MHIRVSKALLVAVLVVVVAAASIHGRSLKTHKHKRNEDNKMTRWARTMGLKSVGHKEGATEMVVKKDGDTKHKRDHDSHKRTIRVDDCWAGGPVQALNYVSGSWMNIFSELVVDCPGEVMRWEFYARQAGTFWASIWRPVAEDRFRMVGSNMIIVENAGKHVTQISPASRIRVEAGDVIGVYHDSSADEVTGGVVAYEDSRFPSSAGVSADSLGTFHNSQTFAENVEVGTMVYGVITDWVSRTIALRAYVGVGSSGGALITLGYDSVAAGTLDTWSNAMYITDPSVQAEQPGLVIGWNLYVERVASVRMQIWRQVNGNNYRLIGETRYEPTEIGPAFITLDEDQQILIEEGDTIGFYFPGDSVIPFSYSDVCESESELLYFQPQGASDANRVESGDGVPFLTADYSWGSCRKYSFAAVVTDAPGGSALMMLGYDASPADYLDEWTNAMYVTDPAQSASVGGTVVGWNIYVERAAAIRMQVWRPMGSNRYTLVGETPLQPTTTGIIHVSLEGDSQIPIQQGDTLGFYFEDLSVIPFSKYYPCNEYNSHRYFQPHVNMGRVEADDAIQFSVAQQDWGACRYYSYSAEIKIGGTVPPGPGPVPPTSGPGPTSGPIGECGTPYYLPNVDGRIVGGITAIPHSWPWMVSLQTASGFPFCGGSLIDRQIVVTAAHCMPGWDSSNRVVLGMHNKNEATETRQERHATEISHPNYNSASSGNDIAVLLLDSPVDYTEEVSPVCLPSRSNTQAGQAGTKCYTTGWGNTASGGSSPDVLLQVGVPIVANEECNQPSWYGGSIDDTMVCAGYEEGGRDSCQGDSGGPLVCQNSAGVWELTGVVSWGYGCAEAFKPGVYAYVPSLRSWLNSVVA